MLPERYWRDVPKGGDGSVSGDIGMRTDKKKGCYLSRRCRVLVSGLLMSIGLKLRRTFRIFGAAFSAAALLAVNNRPSRWCATWGWSPPCVLDEDQLKRIEVPDTFSPGGI